MLTDISCWWSMVVPTFSMILPVAGRLERGWSTVLSSGSFQKGSAVAFFKEFGGRAALKEVLFPLEVGLAVLYWLAILD